MKTKKFILMVLAVVLCYSGYAQLQMDANGRIGVGGVTPSSQLHIKDNWNTIIKLQNGNDNVWQIGNYASSPWSSPNTLAICTQSGYPKMEFRPDHTYIHDRLEIGHGYEDNLPLLELHNQKYMCINALDGDNSGGILFYETQGKEKNRVQYGAKIEYNENNDALIIGTYQNWTANNSIFIDRIYGGVGIGGKLTGSTYKLKVFGRAITTHSVWETSDIRFKEDIKDISTEKNKLKQLRGVSYIKKQLKDSINQTSLGAFQTRNLTQNPPDTLVYSKSDSVDFKKPVVPEREYGFVAQEVQEIFPDLVIEDDEGYLAINYTGFIPLIIESYKEQQTKIEDLEKELVALKNKLKSAPATATVVLSSSLSQNIPNPFSENTEIKYYLDESISKAMINIYNMSGTQLKSIELHQKGDGSVIINGGEFNAGMYMYALIADGIEVDTKRMILTK